MIRLNIVLQIFFLILNFLTFIASNGTYTINAPGTIRSNRKYTVCVTLHNVSEPATIYISVRSNSSWQDVQTVSLQPFETKLVNFYPTKLDPDEVYELTAMGLEGLNFFAYTTLHVNEHDGANIYIETDKGAYKPGDLLRFRVIILNEHAKPMDIIEPIKVQIFDGKSNRVKQFKDIRLNKGFYPDEFQISKDPVLGLWTIKVYIGGKYALEQRAYFKVEKYVLPKFKTFIETDTNFFREDRYIKINVFGRYTNNKYVEGSANMIIRQQRSISDEIITLANYTSDVVDTKAKFEIDLKDIEQKLISDKMFVTAYLAEKHTNLIANRTIIIELQNQRYDMNILDNELEFRNGVPFRIKIELKHWNGTVINDPVTNVILEYGSERYEAKLNDEGIATFEFVYNYETTYTFQYKNVYRKYNFLPYTHDRSTKGEPETNRCDLKIKPERLQLNSDVEIVVESNNNIPYFVYTLTSHGNTIKHDLVRLETNQNSSTIQLATSNEMVPVSFLYVHYIIDGHLIFCETKIELPKELENKLSLSAPREVKPGDNITMTINAQPGSHVAMVAIDLSSLLYSDANRINIHNILENMRNDISYAFRRFETNPGILSGQITLTDAYYKKRKIDLFKKTNLIEDFHHMIAYKESNNFPSLVDLTEIVNNKVRTYFPETWIFSDFDVTSEVTTVDFKVPDSITSWIVAAFSINEKTGIGLLDPTVEITASKAFFINTYLPYSIKRGEIVSIPIVIFNYLPENLQTEVVMENYLHEFKFVEEIDNQMTDSVIEKRNIIVPANSGKSVNFLINPQKLGEVSIRVQAKNKLASDSIIQKLLVEPHGLDISHNHQLFVVLKPGQDHNTYYKTNIPSNVVDESQSLQLSLSGNVLFPALENLDDLVNKPTGCGEQNMIHFAPNILVLEYLSATRQNSKYKDLVEKAKEYTQIGYQQQLKFRHNNGGYSVFGPKFSRTPSNWLTAYVVRFFIKAVKYLSIEPKIIESSLSFLASQQLSDGEFTNAGYLFHPAYQSRYGFTGFVLMSFLENSKYSKKYKEVVRKALSFLSNNINEIDDTYSLAIVATVFQMAKHEQAAVIMDKLRPLAKTDNNLQWWADNTDGDKVTDIEITSYILLALLHTPGQYMPIVKWLLEQRNSHGGFKSTQDTVVGLQALIKFSQFIASENNTLIKVEYRALNIQNEELENNVLGLDPTTAEILQHQELPPSTRSLDLKISGTGNIFLQFSYQYRELLHKKRNVVALSDYSTSNDNDNDIKKPFIIKTNVELADKGWKLDLELCIQYKPLKNEKISKTNMIIAEIDLPSGYIINDEFLEEFKNNEYVDRIENKRPDKIVLYYSQLEADEEKCVNLLADKKDDVRNLMPCIIEVYDYYNILRGEIVQYEIKTN